MKNIKYYLTLLTLPALAYGNPGTGSKDHSKIVGAESCAECHESATAVWKGTHHYSTYVDLPEKPEAAKIAQAMGIDAYKLNTSETCRQCHFTVQSKDSALNAISGVSCESCHGAAADWIDIHNNEKADKTKRMSDAAEKGMNRPGNYYTLFKNCYECHTAPNEELVNKGGHSAGSDFELVSWSSGEIRHTFDDDGKVNEVASPEKKRVLYILGKGLDMEAALEGLIEAKDTNGAYFQAMVKRFAKAFKGLKEIDAKLGGNADVKAMIDALGTKINPKDKATLQAAHEGLHKLLVSFSEKADGATLAGVDALIPTTTKGTPKK
jgi:hypothetical protein